MNLLIRDISIDLRDDLAQIVVGRRIYGQIKTAEFAAILPLDADFLTLRGHFYRLIRVTVAWAFEIDWYVFSKTDDRVNPERVLLYEHVNCEIDWEGSSRQ